MSGFLFFVPVKWKMSFHVLPIVVVVVVIWILQRTGGQRGEKRWKKEGRKEGLPLRGVPETTVVRIKKEIINFMPDILCKI